MRECKYLVACSKHRGSNEQTQTTAVVRGGRKKERNKKRESYMGGGDREWNSFATEIFAVRGCIQLGWRLICIVG